MMTTLADDLNSLPHELMEAHDHHPVEVPFSPKPQTSSTASPFPYFLSRPSYDQVGESLQCHQQEGYDELVPPMGGSSSCDFLKAEHDNNNINALKFTMTMGKKNDQGDELSQSYLDTQQNGSTMWMSSKMRLMRKMMNSDQMGMVERSTEVARDYGDLSRPFLPSKLDNNDNNNNNNNSNTINIRVCADCNTTKTPLWRSGPRGPKSLCNACGIRQRKARRAMAAAAAMENGTASPTNTKCKVQPKIKKSSSNGCAVHYKKRTKLATAASPQKIAGGKKKLRFEDFALRLSETSAVYHQVFPQDEKDAAILLMALSCGLVHG